jgi:hypothetical protein
MMQFVLLAREKQLIRSEKIMNKVELEDELRPEYDLTSLRVRKLGKERQKFGDLVRLEPDIIEAFPNAELVNAALRSLLEIAKRSTQTIQTSNDISSHA